MAALVPRNQKTSKNKIFKMEMLHNELCLVISSAIKDQNLFYIFNILTNNSDMCLHKR